MEGGRVDIFLVNCFIWIYFEYFSEFDSWSVSF